MTSPSPVEVLTQVRAGEALSYNQYAARHGLVTDYDVQGHIHGGLMAAHMPRSYHRRYQKKLAELQAAREAGQLLYRQAIADGLIAPPVEKTHLQRLEEAASGDPDLASTQAAKRLLEKRKDRALDLARQKEAGGDV